MKKSFMERMAAFIVDKRRLFVVLFAVACVLSVFSVSKTDVNNELTDYLPDSTQTRQGLEIMNREFITYGDAKVMVSNVTFTQAEELAEMLRGVDGVKSVEFEKDTQHYNSASALFVVTFDGEKLDEISIQGVKNVRAAARPAMIPILQRRSATRLAEILEPGDAHRAHHPHVLDLCGAFAHEPYVC